MPPRPSWFIDGRADLHRLHAEWGARLHGYLAAVLGSRRAAEDLLPDVLLHLAAKADQVASAPDPLAYGLRVAVHLVRDRMRRERHRAAHGQDALVLLPAPEDRGLDADTVARVNAAIAGLPADQREVVALKVWDGRTFAEIAGILDLSPNTAASRYRYALATLRRTLEGIRDA